MNSTRIAVLLRDYGYRFSGDTLIRKAIKGHTSEEIVGRFRDNRDAAEYLCPIIADADFTARLNEGQPHGLDAKIDRMRMALDYIEGFKGLELDIIMRHLRQALTSSTGQFIIKRIGSYQTQGLEPKGVRLKADLTVLVAPTYKVEREATFTFEYDGNKFKGQIVPNKAGPSESNVRDKKCKRTRMRREGRAFKRAVALIDVEDLFR